MATEIRVPTLGESVTEATVGKWYKKAGDSIAADEILLELETDKVTVEVPAPAAGVLAEITAQEGETVGLGALLGTIGEGSGAPAKPAAKAEAKPEAVAQAAGASGADTTKEAAEKTAKIAGEGPVEKRDMPPAPAAAKLLAENNLSADQVAGSGKRGQVLKGDVLDAIARGAPSQPAETPAVPVTARAPSPADDASREERVKMTRLRQTIARRLKDAQSTAAMLTTFNEVDMSGVAALRAKYKDRFSEVHGVGLGLMSFFARAVVLALAEYPTVNAFIDGAEILYHDYVNLGIAVSTERGLVVPVLQHAEAMSMARIEAEIKRLAQGARDNKLSMDDLGGGTFTITNGGVFGSLLSTPILNAPQSGILGMHAIQQRPVAVDGRVEIRPMMYVALSYDHRLVDGQQSVSFLVRVKQLVEDPARLLLQV
jgi:2-oxoglutarate dehydrogenase E2 component (dihydrolipoamide succinyltransferase)